MKPKDPIVEEIHALREALAEAHGNDLEEIVRAAREVGDNQGRRLETLPPRRVPPSKKAS